MKIVFFGNTKYSRIGLEIIHEALGVAAVITIPDTLDRKDRPVPSPTKQFALEHNLPVIEAEKMYEWKIQEIAALQADIFVVEDYGLILPEAVLSLAKLAPINIHHSLLPKYRGPSPAPTAIRNGDPVSGVTVIHMSKRMDAGDIYAQQEYTLKPDETTDSLLSVLNTIGAGLAVNVINHIAKGTAKRTPQAEDQATYTSFMKKTDGFIDIENPPEKQTIDRMVRAYYPWPSAWTKIEIDNGEWRIIKLLPGQMIQMEGKKPMSYKDFFNGYPDLKNKLETILNSEF